MFVLPYYLPSLLCGKISCFASAIIRNPHFVLLAHDGCSSSVYIDSCKHDLCIHFPHYFTTIFLNCIEFYLFTVFAVLTA